MPYGLHGAFPKQFILTTMEGNKTVLRQEIPCRVIREITDADRDKYYKDKTFDVDDY